MAGARVLAMDDPGHKRWLPAVLLLGVVYLAAGTVFGALAGSSASNPMRVTWRLAAWVISAAAFACHIACEHFRLHNSPVVTALRVSLAAALGAFGLAVAAGVHAVHAQTTSSHQRRLAMALIIWPILTAVPAFVVALAAAFGLARVRKAS